jgi:hypothetical protein
MLLLHGVLARLNERPSKYVRALPVNRTAAAIDDRGEAGDWGRRYGIAARRRVYVPAQRVCERVRPAGRPVPRERAGPAT